MLAQSLQSCRSTGIDLCVSRISARERTDTQVHMIRDVARILGVTGVLDCRSCARARRPSWFESESRRGFDRVVSFRFMTVSNNA